MAEVRLNDFSKEDYAHLDGSQKKLVDKAFLKLEERGFLAGEALYGNLHTCRKLKNKKAGLRIVFRQSEISTEILEIIEIIVIGKRDRKKFIK